MVFYSLGPKVCSLTIPDDILEFYACIVTPVPLAPNPVLNLNLNPDPNLLIAPQIKIKIKITKRDKTDS